jgi:hypothetical protein
MESVPIVSDSGSGRCGPTLRRVRQRLAVQELEMEIARATITVKMEQMDEVRNSQAHMLALVEQRTSEATLLKGLVEEAECPLCLERPGVSMFYPCGHCFCCHKECQSSQVATCPICSQSVSDKTRLFGAITTLGDMVQSGLIESGPDTELARLTENNSGHAERSLDAMRLYIKATIKAKEDEQASSVVASLHFETVELEREIAEKDALVAAEHRCQAEASHKILRRLQVQNREMEGHIKRLCQEQSTLLHKFVNVLQKHVQQHITKLSLEHEQQTQARQQVAIMEILEWQTTCLIGPLGATQKRLERTSGAHLKFKETTLEISGTAHQRQLARLYIDLTLQLKTSNPSDSDVVDDARIGVATISRLL